MIYYLIFSVLCDVSTLNVYLSKHEGLFVVRWV